MSNLINKTRLQKFAEGFWAKIKGRYDGTFKEAEISASTETEKKITLTKVDNTTKEISLADYARLQDRNEFKKDVSVDDADFYNNASLGRMTGTVDPTNRTLGARNLTSKMFTDGFVSTLRIHLDSSHTTSQMLVHLWEIKKGNSKQEDRTISKLKNGESFTVTQVGNEKYVDIAINKKYEEDTYFLFRSGNSAVVKAISNIPRDKANDVMNLVDTTPPAGTGQALDLSNQRENETAYVEIFGRIGIKDLNSKINQLQADGSKYVLQSETTATSAPNKVVRLDGEGKINSNMLPSIAINEYIEVATFDHTTLQGKRFENGDVVVVTNGGVVTKRYLCIDKEHNTGNLVNAFVELNSKDGVVQSVNGKVGAVELQLQATNDKVKLNITSAGSTATTEVDIISDTEITAILDALQ
nr:MAG TPA: hypothetical protein [Caudoviricetes sp.]